MDISATIWSLIWDITRQIQPVSVLLGRKSASTRLEEGFGEQRCSHWGCVSVFPPEIPPPAPLQTQDGSAVAKTDTTVVLRCFIFWSVFFFFPLLFGPVAADCAETFLFMQRRSTNTKQTPDGNSQHKPANRDLREGDGGGSYNKNWQPPAQILQHWCVFRN